MDRKYKEFIKNIVIFGIGTFGSKFISFLMVPLYTSIIAAGDYGTVNLMNTMSSLLMPIFLLSIHDAILRFTLDRDYESEDVISTAVKVIIIGNIIFLILISFLYIFNVFSLSIEYYLYLFMYFFFGAFSSAFTLYLKGKNKSTIVAISGIVNTLVTCLLNLVTLVVFKWGILGYMLSNVFGAITSTLTLFLGGKIYKDIHILRYKSLFKPMTMYCLPLIPNSLGWWINNASDRYILTFFKGVTQNGIYSVSYTIPNMLAVFQNVIYNAWSISAITEFDNKESGKFISNNLMIYSFVSFVMCSILIAFNIPISTFLYKGDYFVAWKAVPFLLVGSTFNGIALFEGCVFAAAKQTKTVTVTTLLGALFNTVLNFIFIPMFGYCAAALTTMIGYFVMWALRTFYLRRIVKLRINWLGYLSSIGLVVIQAFVATLGLSIYMQIMCLVGLLVLNVKYIKSVMVMLQNLCSKKRYDG